MTLIVTRKKNGIRLRVLGEIEGRFGEQRIQVQKETAEGLHGVFSLKPDDIDGLVEACTDFDDEDMYPGEDIDGPL